MEKYSCDFETSTWLQDKSYVWAWAICSIDNNYNIKYGNNINSFFDYIFQFKTSVKLYFHNLKFDGSFILNWLLNNGFEWISDKKEKGINKFTTLISDNGLWYNITIFTLVKNKLIQIEIIDSLKIIPFSVKDIAKAFNLPILKGEIDYNLKRSENHIMTEDEKEYIKNDVEIVARALNVLFSQGMQGMTTAKNALDFYKNTIDKKRYSKLFPELTFEVDSYIRQSYKGGFTYLNPKYSEKIIKDGIVLDVNSLYPSRMYNEVLPVGEPMYFTGKYVKNKSYPLYVQTIECIFEIKEGYIPTIQIKNNRYRFQENEYLTSSRGEIVNLTLTNVDLELFLEHYEVIDLNYIDGFMFRGVKGIFCSYIDYWTEQKIKAKKEGNGGMYTLAKLMLNSLYGKFGKNPQMSSKIPYLKDNILHFKNTEIEIKDSLYIPIATFITAYARNLTIRSAQKVKDRFIYADTDSLHLEGLEVPKNLEIDDYKLGAWKHESTFKKAKFIRQKCYIELETDDNLKITIAGMPSDCKKYVNFDNFKIGSVFNGKLVPKQVKGGVNLVETTFKIKG